MKSNEKLFVKSPYYNNSQILWFLQSKKSSIIGIEMICGLCFGIAINPIVCQKCKNSFCSNCLINFKNKTVCDCPELINDNNTNLTAFLEKHEKSTYSFYYDLSPGSKLEVPYREAISKLSDQESNNLIKNLNENESIFDDEYQRPRSKRIMKMVIRHSSRCLKNFPLKIRKMLKYIQYFELMIKGKLLCRNDLINIKDYKIKGLELINCIFGIDFAFEMASFIKKNKFFFVKCSLSDENITLKSILILLKSISLCKNLKQFSIGCYLGERNNWLNAIFLSSSLNQKRFLQKLSISNIFFSHEMNCDIFGPLISLTNLEVITCYFQGDGLFRFLFNLSELKKLRILIINNNNLLIWNDNEKSWVPFTKNLTDLKSIEKLEINEFYTSNQYTLNMIMINYVFYNQSIISLRITFISLYEKDAQTISKCIGSLKSVKKLKFTLYNSTFLNLILEGIIRNNKLEEIDLSHCDCSGYTILIQQMLKVKGNLNILNLTKCNLVLENNFAEHFANNKNIQILYLNENKIFESGLNILLRSNLKTVHLDQTNLSKHTIDHFQAKLSQKSKYMKIVKKK